MRFLAALGSKFWAHKWLWLYGSIVFLLLVVISLPLRNELTSNGEAPSLVGIRIFSISYFVYSPNLWPPYIFATPDLFTFEPPVAVAFTFQYSLHYWPWNVSVGLFISTVLFWLATAFVTTTLVAAICGGLHLKRKRLVLWIDVAIVLLFIAYLGYADARIFVLPVAWRFDVLAITLSILALWALLTTLGHRPPFLGLGRRKGYVAAVVLAAIACLGIIAYYDSNSISFTAQSLKPWTWTFIAAVWLLTVIWLLCEISRKISFRLKGLLPYILAYGAVAAIALTVGIHSFTDFEPVKDVLIRVLWLPHFNISHLISTPANELVPYYSEVGLDIYRIPILNIPGFQYSYFSGWNILSFLFTLMWWAILSRVFVVLGRQFYATVIKREVVVQEVLAEVDDTANDVADATSEGTD